MPQELDQPEVVWDFLVCHGAHIPQAQGDQLDMPPKTSILGHATLQMAWVYAVIAEVASLQKYSASSQGANQEASRQQRIRQMLEYVEANDRVEFPRRIRKRGAALEERDVKPTPLRAVSREFQGGTVHVDSSNLITF